MYHLWESVYSNSLPILLKKKLILAVLLHGSEILTPQLGTEPMPPAAEALINRWTRKVPEFLSNSVVLYEGYWI